MVSRLDLCAKTVSFVEGFGIRLHRKYGKFRTDYLAIMAVDTFPLLGNHRWMIAFAVEFIGKLEDVLGAEFDAIAAAFAPIIDDAHRSPSDLYLLGIKRYSPKSHVTCLYCDKSYLGLCGGLWPRAQVKGSWRRTASGVRSLEIDRKNKQVSSRKGGYLEKN
jgi:hypothetical protein